MNTKTVELLTGTLSVPDDFLIAENTKTEKSDYAGVIAVKNETVPHIVIFSEKPVNEFTGDEEDAAVEAGCQVYPGLREIREREVAPLFTKFGTLANTKEWCESPHIGVFGIPDVKTNAEMLCDTGIKRR